MGVEDRDWYREHHRQQRKNRQAAFQHDRSYAADRGEDWPSIRRALWRASVNSFALYGAITAVGKLVIWWLR